jgi:hypothetical protein
MREMLSQSAALVLSGLLAIQAPLGAQARPGLKILVIEGEGAINNIQLGSGREPVVEVRDESDRPVSGAKVTFALPERGPGGTFFGASRTVTVPTNEQGRAAGTGFRPNLQEGRFQIQVTAHSGERTATAVINQTNSLPTGAVNRANGGRGFGKGKIIAILVAAGIIAGIAAAAGGDDKAPATAAAGTSITPGVVSVGAPR